MTPAPRSMLWRGQPISATAKRLGKTSARSEEHTSELQSLRHLVCRLLLEKKKYQHLRSITIPASARRALSGLPAEGRRCTRTETRTTIRDYTETFSGNQTTTKTARPMRA